MPIRTYRLAELDDLLGSAVKDRHGSILFISSVYRKWLDFARITLTPDIDDTEDEITVSAMCLALDFTFLDGKPCGVDNV